MLQNSKMDRSVLIHLLLLLVSVNSIHIPFYCKIRKTNCQLRPESTCCQHLSTTTTTTSSDTTIDTITQNVDVTEIPKHKEPESILNSSDVDIFEAVPSEIDEVYVKVTGENIETNFLTSTEKPEKYAPRFCLKLKFNCKLRSTHACCKYPLPPRDENQGPAIENTKAVKLPVRPTRIQIPPNTVGKIKNRKSPFRRPLRPQQTKIDKPSNKDAIKELKAYDTENNLGKEATKNIIQRPDTIQVRKSTIKRRRPASAYISNNKSPVCRIINCARNKNHKCCQKPIKRSTTEASTTTFTTEPYETTQYVEILTERQKNPKIEKEAQLTKEGTVIKSTTSSYEEYLPSEVIKSKVMLDNTNDQVAEINSSQVDVNNVKNETYSNITDQGESIANEDLKMQIKYNQTKEMRDQTLLTSNIQHEKTAAENQFKPDENLDFENVSQYPNDSQQVYGQTNKMNETKNKNVNDEILEEENVEQEDEKSKESTMSEYIDKTNAFKLADSVQQENEEPSDTIKSMNSIIFVDEELLDVDYPENVDNYQETIIYEDNEQVKTDTEKRVDYAPSTQPVVPYNTIEHESLLDPNQILPRVSVECFRYDCLSEPHHDCCNPHTTDKRHTGPVDTDNKQLEDKMIEDSHDRVTSSVTRVMKTVRW